MKQYRVLAINPGSTSTKIALFEGETCLFSKNVAHDAQELAKFKTIPDQRPYREKTILDLAEFYRLSCNMSPEAAQVAYRGMNPEA